MLWRPDALPILIMVALLWPSVCIAPNANIAAMATNGPRGWPRKSSTKLDMMQGIKRMAANYRSATRTGRFSGMGLDLRSHAQYNAMTSESQALTSTTNQKSRKKSFFGRFRHQQGGSQSPGKWSEKVQGYIKSKPWRSLTQEGKSSSLPRMKSSISYDSISSRRRSSSSTSSSSTSEESIDMASPSPGIRRGTEQREKGQRETGRRAWRQGQGVESPSRESPSHHWRPTAPISSPRTPVNPGISKWPSDRRLPSPESGPLPQSGLFLETPSTSGKQRDLVYGRD